MKIFTLALLGSVALAAFPTQAKAWDYYECRHYLRAAKSYMKAARFDEAKKEIRKAEKEGCPSNVSFE